jgi:hypothetical protein
LFCGVHIDFRALLLDQSLQSVIFNADITNEQKIKPSLCCAEREKYFPISNHDE